LELERVSFITVSKKYSPAMESKGREMAISITKVSPIFFMTISPFIFPKLLEAKTCSGMG
jgi:hypothetical protein